MESNLPSTNRTWIFIIVLDFVFGGRVVSTKSWGIVVLSGGLPQGSVLGHLKKITSLVLFHQA